MVGVAKWLRHWTVTHNVIIEKFIIIQNIIYIYINYILIFKIKKYTKTDVEFIVV